MSDIGKVAASAVQFSRFLRDYGVSRQGRGRVLGSVFKGRVNPLTWRFIELLEQRRRVGILPEICESFLELCRKAAGIKKVRLISAAPMEKEQELELTARIRQRVGGPMELVSTVKPSLLGGFTVQVEDTLYDWSVTGALKAMRNRLAAARG